MTDSLAAQVERALGSQLPPLVYRYSERDAALYALGIGAPADWLDPDELKFVYEGSPDFQVIPTFAALFGGRLVRSMLGGELGGIRFNPLMLVHGEQQLEIKRSLPPAATVTSQPRIAEIYDKGSGMLIVIASESRDESGALLALSRSAVFIRGLGGFGGPRGSGAAESALPASPPDALHEEKTLDIQALLYRLSGDSNPLHADPQMAALGNFERPILHGLCFFGFAARAIIRHFCGNDARRLREIRARFAAPVFPGDALRTEMWRVADDEIAFRMQARDATVLSHARARIEG